MALSWRDRLLLGIAAVFVVGEVWMFVRASDALRLALALLTGVYLTATGGVYAHYRKRLTENLLTANLALGAIVHLALTASIVLVDRLMDLGVVPALAQNGYHFALGALGIGGAYVAWTRARGVPDAEVAPPEDAHEEPAPPASASREGVDWEAAEADLEGDPRRRRELARLRRIAGLLDGDGPDQERLDEVRRVVDQETRRLLDEAAADARDDDDVLTQAANLLEWGAQKLPELAELDVSDVLMGKAIADIRAKSDRVTSRFVDHRDLRAIHPIDRATAEAKCDERAEAARAALPLLRANNMRLSEELIAARDELAAFRSVTGFQVVELTDGGFVTFEGNGRREALQRAFGADEPVLVEVRHYVFDDPGVAATIDRRVRRVRRWKGVEENS